MSKLIARLLPGAALLLASCSSTGPSSPTQLEFSGPVPGASSMMINAMATAPPRSALIGCAVVTPFIMPVLVTVSPVGGISVVVTNITTQFTNNRGINAPAVTLPAPIPITQYGTALQQAKNQQFAFDVCTATPGTVFLAIDARDATGRTMTGSATIAVQ